VFFHLALLVIITEVDIVVAVIANETDDLRKSSGHFYATGTNVRSIIGAVSEEI
jgi:hypothetical protein